MNEFAGVRIDELQARIRLLCTEKGWREKPELGAGHGGKEGPWFAAYIALAHSELSEALEAYRENLWSGTQKINRRKNDHGEVTLTEIDKPIGVGPELADVIIRILDMCDIWDIDIGFELDRVLKYGWTRPYQHGGKTL